MAMAGLARLADTRLSDVRFFFTGILEIVAEQRLEWFLQNNLAQVGMIHPPLIFVSSTTVLVVLAITYLRLCSDLTLCTKTIPCYSIYGFPNLGWISGHGPLVLDFLHGRSQTFAFLVRTESFDPMTNK